MNFSHTILAIILPVNDEYSTSITGRIIFLDFILFNLHPIYPHMCAVRLCIRLNALLVVMLIFR